MRYRPTSWIVLLLMGFAAGLVWWVVEAGPVTVYRILRYNLSDIDDDRIFPRASLRPSPHPFHFQEAPRPSLGHVSLTLESAGPVSLATVLQASETVAFLILRDDTILYEYYGRGYDRRTPSMSFSMAKSVLALLVGCAFDDGLFRTLDQSATDFVPELAERGFAPVTIRHLLQMTSGVAYAENDNPFGQHARAYYTQDLEREILSLTMEEMPGARFRYKSGDAFLLTLALRRALASRTLVEYTQARVWDALGMEDEGAWSLDRSPGGLEKTGCCLTATARDFAKIGRLYLNRGLWDGRRIVSEAWVTETMASRTEGGGAWHYRRMWWKVRRDRPDILAAGHLGQFLYVNPSARTVMVRLGRSLGGLSRQQWGELFIRLSDAVTTVEVTRERPRAAWARVPVP